ncbi:uncharacterized protein LOC117646664 [Thrips palmi]|uniref:Uncharacterized protein LOC117646664 n=1 Tax=Thrips palmi TaxID=161013 RepID=A0A6P8Z128_THRPL|nr:uncharacterized protein LOC117646664 [Thrips palmi]
MCCLDFNMTYIDLGGPGCVRLRYLGQDAGVAMNVSYGDSLLHSEVVKDSSPSGTCMDILSSLAQVCARFTSLAAMAPAAPSAATPQAESAAEGSGDGMKRGCLQLEPTLLGEVQAAYPVGCFRMTPQAMTMEPQAAPSQPEEGQAGQAEGQGAAAGAAGTTEAPTTPTDISAESLMAAVSETAEQGIDLLTNWLGLALEEDNNSTTTEGQDGQDASTTTAAPEESASARAYRRNRVSLSL